jgi:hypothetical protein
LTTDFTDLGSLAKKFQWEMVKNRRNWGITMLPLLGWNSLDFCEFIGVLQNSIEPQRHSGGVEQQSAKAGLGSLDYWIIGLVD